MGWLRKTLFWAHLVTGAVMAAVILIMSLTGVALTYQRQITAWADTRGLDSGPPEAGTEPLAIEELLDRVTSEAEGTPTLIRWQSEPDRPVEVAFGRGRTLFVNWYTGEVLGEGSVSVRKFFRTMTSWHRWLGAEGDSRPSARAVTGASNLGFLFLVVSGLFLWWPRNLRWPAFRNVLFFRRGLSSKARDFNWHHVIGFWTLVPLFLVVLSGVVISYRWASDLVYVAVGEEPPPVVRRGGGGGGRGASQPSSPSPSAAGSERSAQPLDLLLQRAGLEVAPGWRTIALQLTGAPDKASFSVDYGAGGQPQKRVQVELDRSSGALVGTTSFADNSRGRRIRSFLRFAHTGEVAGWIGQTVAGLVSLGSAVLVWTGLALSWRRLRSWLGRRARRGSWPEPRGGERHPANRRPRSAAKSSAR